MIKPNNNQFHFLYINKDSLNAFATIFQDIDVVALNIGTIIEIDNYFIRAVNTGIFEWLDNQLARRTLVNVLTIMAIEFIILHELGHIYNGHLEFDSVSRLRRMLLHEGNLESRTIEMDADAYATTRSFSKYLQQNIESEMKIIASNKLDMLRFWVFATHSFFFLFEQTFLNYDEMHLEDYYPRIIRQALNMEISTRIVSEYEPDLVENYEKVLNDTFSLAENVYSRIGGRSASRRKEEILTINDPRVVSYMEQVDEYYESTLRHKLGKYARHNLYHRQ